MTQDHTAKSVLCKTNFERDAGNQHKNADFMGPWMIRHDRIMGTVTGGDPQSGTGSFLPVSQVFCQPGVPPTSCSRFLHDGGHESLP
jgi:hypothetical protein